MLSALLRLLLAVVPCLFCSFILSCLFFYACQFPLCVGRFQSSLELCISIHPDSHPAKRGRQRGTSGKSGCMTFGACDVLVLVILGRPSSAGRGHPARGAGAVFHAAPSIMPDSMRLAAAPTSWRVLGCRLLPAATAAAATAGLGLATAAAAPASASAAGVCRCF